MKNLNISEVFIGEA